MAIATEKQSGCPYLNSLSAMRKTRLKKFAKAKGCANMNCRVSSENASLYEVVHLVPDYKPRTCSKRVDRANCFFYVFATFHDP